MSLADNGVWKFHIHRPSMSLRGELVARGELVLAGLYPCLLSRTRRSFTSLYIRGRTEPLMPSERRFCKVKCRTAPPRRVVAPGSARGAPPAEPRGGPGHPARRKPRPEGERPAEPPGRTARPRCVTRPVFPWDHRQAAAGRRGARRRRRRRGSRCADAPRGGEPQEVSRQSPATPFGL